MIAVYTPAFHSLSKVDRCRELTPPPPPRHQTRSKISSCPSCFLFFVVSACSSSFFPCYRRVTAASHRDSPYHHNKTKDYRPLPAADPHTSVAQCVSSNVIGRRCTIFLSFLFLLLLLLSVSLSLSLVILLPVGGKSLGKLSARSRAALSYRFTSRRSRESLDGLKREFFQRVWSIVSSHD